VAFLGKPGIVRKGFVAHESQIAENFSDKPVFKSVKYENFWVKAV